MGDSGRRKYSHIRKIFLRFGWLFQQLHGVCTISFTSTYMASTDVAQTICSMTPIFLQIDPEVYPNPHAFMPERWMNLDEPQRQRLEHNLVPYSKGTRGCAGLT